MPDIQVKKLSANRPCGTQGVDAFSDYFTDPSGRTVTRRGTPYCVSCKELTNESYKNHPLLRCWNCNHVMWDLRPDNQKVGPTEQQMRQFIEEHAQGLEMHARSYRDILRSSNARLLKYAYEMAVESERVFNDQADRAEATAAPTAASEEQ